MICKAMLVMTAATMVAGQAGFSGIQAFGPFAAALMGQKGAAPYQQQQQPQQAGGELPPGLAHLQLQLSHLLQQQQQQQQLPAQGYYPQAQTFTSQFPSSVAGAHGFTSNFPAVTRAQPLPPKQSSTAPASPVPSLLGVAFSPANTASQLRFSGFGANYSY